MRMFTQILVRTRVPPLSILRDVRAELVRIDREQQVMRVRDLEGWITNLPEYAQQRLVARLFAIFSMLALALSAVGLYSVVSYGVATRTNEFGIRMALGARARDVTKPGTQAAGAGNLVAILILFVLLSGPVLLPSAARARSSCCSARSSPWGCPCSTSWAQGIGASTRQPCSSSGA